MRASSSIKKRLKEVADPAKAEVLQRFFKTGKGEYAHGDIFLGVAVPDQRKIVGEFGEVGSSEIKTLLRDKIHEYRFCALLLMIRSYEKGDKDRIIDLYFENLDFVNNWDLVDVSAPRIPGDFFLTGNRDRLEELLSSNDLWRRRIAMVSTLSFIRNDLLEPTFRYAKVLMSDNHHLIHKAVGWMLREAGKRDESALKSFLNVHAHLMPRTMLRYSIEMFDKEERGRFLNLRSSRVNVGR